MKCLLVLLLLLLLFCLVYLYLTVACGESGSVISFLFPSGAVTLFCIYIVSMALFYKK